MSHRYWANFWVHKQVQVPKYGSRFPSTGPILGIYIGPGSRVRFQIPKYGSRFPSMDFGWLNIIGTYGAFGSNKTSKKNNFNRSLELTVLIYILCLNSKSSLSLLASFNMLANFSAISLIRFVFVKWFPSISDCKPFFESSNCLCNSAFSFSSL